MSDAAPPPPYQPGASAPPPPGYQQGSYQQGWGTAAPRNGLGTAALVLGIIGILVCWTVVGGFLLGLLALIFGIMGRRRVRRNEATNGGAALTGIILGGLAFVIAIVFIAAGAVFFVHHKDDFKNLQDCLNSGHTSDYCNQQFKDSINN